MAVIASLILGMVPASASTSWLGYHGDRARTAFDPSEPSFAAARPAWKANLGAAVYGQPVVADGRVFAATEKNQFVALDPRSGRILWAKSVGRPVTGVDRLVGCGNIDPLGITSTPVIDLGTHTVFVVGEVSDGGNAVHHQLMGFDTRTGAVLTSENADPPLPAGGPRYALLQRAALALGNGRVYVAFGGNSGDCGTYHGWLVGLRETGAPDPVTFEVAADGHGGGIWESGGGPAIAADGHVYVSTGNSDPFPGHNPDPSLYAESVIELPPDLGVPVASFRDPAASGDGDLAAGNPLLLPDGTVFAVGKTDVAYVLRRGDLSVVTTIAGVCGSDPDGGAAFDVANDTIFVPCRGGGIQEVDLRHGRVGRKLPGANGAPILVADHLWALDYPAGILHEYNAASGAPLQTVPVGVTVPTFASPSAALGLLLVGTKDGVVAFRGAASFSASSTGAARSASHVPASSTVFYSAWGIVAALAVVVAAAVMIVGLVTYRIQGRRSER
ncbi:MAG: PQQ-binding-like beta-propeller repeat protein [Actinomycetota bacterium]|nr:PQQ-binding-like beta-propeller repeat protein [Actinomycetota bacterium]